ncbi:MAG: hypothetical protein A2175_00515 [Candidatus Nealsonbacteria bacterium RBG_13_42_11]|uniref:Uncharacterized protein n=1 Tax=Candidatus Nealsonbacteria bacterium RBG_13_42_11 TaxID=1801663 RepID=A0A1G2DYX3_9BACT|nr:MAG: hypothetical protein A2175_00515 [Candidatus Nealsonbacteria bacterium RBG_13_42_11]
MEPEELKHKDFYYEGKNLTYQVNVKENLIYIVVKGVHAKEDAEEFDAKAITYLKKFPEIYKVFDTANVIIECSEAKRVEPDARRIYSKMAAAFLHSHLFVVGANTLIRVVLGFLLVASGRKDVKFFKNTSETLEYIRKQKGAKAKK